MRYPAEVYSDKDRTKVHRGIVAVWREILNVLPDTPHARLDEHFLRWCGHVEVASAPADPGGILVRTEQTDLAVSSSEGLQALETCIGIVKHSCKCTEMEIKILRCSQRRPLAVLVVADDDGVSLSVIEREI
jgi:hypothetical protein